MKLLVRSGAAWGRTVLGLSVGLSVACSGKTVTEGSPTGTSGESVTSGGISSGGISSGGSTTGTTTGGVTGTTTGSTSGAATGGTTTGTGPGGSSTGAPTGNSTTGGTTTGTSTGVVTGTTSGTTTGTTPGGSVDCDSVVLSSPGGERMIDNFDHGFSWNLSDDSDGRVGTWEHEFWDFTGESNDRVFGEPECGEPEGCQTEMDKSPGYMKISCSGEGDQGWCATAWDSNNPWAQWAAASTRLTSFTNNEEHNCYNAAQYTGISFKARSPSGNDKLRLQVVDPRADPSQGWVFRSPTIALVNQWQTYEIPFEDILMPFWVGDAGGPSGSVDARSLEAISFVVRTVTDEQSGVGESLNPYEIHIDDIAFY